MSCWLEQMTDDDPGAAALIRPSLTSPDTAELNRLSAKLERLSAQSKALRKAMRQFGEKFDATAWTAAFNSPDSDDINRVYTVTGGYLALVNNTAEAVRAGAKLTGIKPALGTHGVPGIIEAIRADGGLTRQQADTFAELYRTRNQLQHASPDIQADVVHRQVRLLLGHLPRFVKSYIAWLAKRGVKL
jgi:hypothetical protein